MTALALDRPRADRGETGEPAPSLFDDVGGEPTLDEVLSGVWEGLAAHRPVACPVCGDEMAYGAHARPIGGHCTSCQSTLS
jgi:hypothetical protein